MFEKFRHFLMPKKTKPNIKIKLELSFHAETICIKSFYGRSNLNGREVE